jgi:uncharacterized protein (TIGR02246 family)
MDPFAALESVRRAYMDAFNDGDARGVAMLHTSEAIYLPAGLPPVKGRSAIEELMETSLAHLPDEAEFTFEPVEIRIADDWAVERGVTAASEHFPSGKYVMLYEEEPDGCWRIAWAITNSDAPPPGSGR